MSNKKRFFNRIYSPEQRRLLPLIFSLSWPMMLQGLVHTLVHYVDYAMLGSLGATATAAVGSISTVSWMIGSSTSALGVGLVAYISQSMGAGDEQRARRASAQSVFIALVVGAVFTAITLGLSNYIPVWMNASPEIRDDAAAYFFIFYTAMIPEAVATILGMVLEGARDTKTPMKIAVLENALNVVLNYFLIYRTRRVGLFGAEFTVPGAGMGVRGAALASSISITLAGVLTLIALFRSKAISPRGYSLKPDKKILKPVLGIALPNMLQRLITSFGYVVFASMINALGTISTAAHTVANTVESVFYIPGYGMQVAAATLSGNAIGAGDRKQQRNQAGMIIRLEITMMVLSGLLLFIFAPVLAGLFTKDPDVIALCSVVLRMVAVSEPFYGVSIVTEGMLQGAGQTKMPLLFNVCGMWGVRILGTFICTKLLGFGLTSAWGCMIAHNLLLFVLFTTYYRRGRWNPLSRASSL